MKWILITGCLGLVGAGCLHGGPADKSPSWGGTNLSDRPLLAVWRDIDGNTYTPRLRVAIWNDGRMVFSKDAPRWGTNLFVGRLQPAKLASLKERVRATGVFDLDHNSEIGPSDPWCCLLVNFGEEKQVLYWNEGELDFYWAERPPVHGTFPRGNFKRCWAQVNRIALSFSPQNSRRFQETFEGAPSSWYIKPPVQAAPKTNAEKKP